MSRIFPVIKLDYSIPEKGVHVAKRASGTRIAQCSMNIQGISFCEFAGIEGAPQDQLDKAEKVKTWIAEGMKRIATGASRVAEADIAIEFMTDHHALMDISDRATVRCDIDVVDEIDQGDGGFIGFMKICVG